MFAWSRSVRRRRNGVPRCTPGGVLQPGEAVEPAMVACSINFRRPAAGVASDIFPERAEAGAGASRKGRQVDPWISDELADNGLAGRHPGAATGTACRGIIISSSGAGAGNSTRTG